MFGLPQNIMGMLPPQALAALQQAQSRMGGFGMGQGQGQPQLPPNVMQRLQSFVQPQQQNMGQRVGQMLGNIPQLPFQLPQQAQQRMSQMSPFPAASALADQGGFGQMGGASPQGFRVSPFGG